VDVNIYQPKKACKKRGSRSKRGDFESTESFSNINDMYPYPIVMFARVFLKLDKFQPSQELIGKV
jgi:hypothetical protein